MRLVMFSRNGSAPRLGAMIDTGIVDFSPIGVPDDLALFAALADALLPEAEAFAAEARQDAFAPADVRLHAPLVQPPKNVMCVEFNHPGAVGEFATSGFDIVEGRAVPADIVVCSKPATAIIGPDDAIDSRLDPTSTLDYEGELAIIVGEGGRNITTADAHDHIFGFTILNDVTSRAAQRDHQQWLLSKGSDTFCPLGPAVVTANELPSLDSAWVRTSVNGVMRQEYRIGSLTYGPDALLSRLSQRVTLEPGDVIACGTGPGTGISMRPPRFLEPGDIVEVEIDGIGTLSNPIV